MIFDKLNYGLSVILIFVAIILVASLTVRLIVRYVFITPDMSRRGFSRVENIASGFVALLLGIMMWFVLGSMK